jgi:hypothetical protein
MSEIQVPLELQLVLREFTKSVLREGPEDVLTYSRDYFVEKAAQLRISSYTLPPSTSKAFNGLDIELQEQIEAVFKRCSPPPLHTNGLNQPLQTGPARPHCRKPLLHCPPPS